MFQEIIAFLSPVTLYRPSRVPQWAHTGVLERAMSLITGVAVTWVPSAKMACLTAVPSGSQCKCEVTLWHLGIHAQERFHGCMHWCMLTYARGHTHTQTCTYTHLSPLTPEALEKVVDTSTVPKVLIAVSRPLHPSEKEHALIQGVLTILLRPFWVIHPALVVLRTFKEKGEVKSLQRITVQWKHLIKEWKQNMPISILQPRMNASTYWHHRRIILKV